MECLPLWATYIGEKRRGLWTKHRGLRQGAIGNTLGEHIGNPLRTWREHVGNKGKMKNSSPSPRPGLKLKRKKIKAPWVHASAYPLAARIFGFQNCWSPFLAWANSWVSDLGTQYSSKMWCVQKWKINYHCWYCEASQSLSLAKSLIVNVST
jgi:hypothetical protein